jgi:CheY-like chemotaxis protein
METVAMHTLEILLIEDNPGDVRLTQEAFKDARIDSRLRVAQNGEDAIAYLRREGKFQEAARPDIILLDLNLPRLSGREVLAIIKSDDQFKHIPVVVLTTSENEDDILSSYQLHANCYITKPVDLNRFIAIINTINEFWFTVVRLPTAG